MLELGQKVRGSTTPALILDIIYRTDPKLLWFNLGLKSISIKVLKYKMVGLSRSMHNSLLTFERHEANKLEN